MIKVEVIFMLHNEARYNQGNIASFHLKVSDEAVWTAILKLGYI